MSAPQTPSQALINEGLGMPTTPQAVSRCLKLGGFTDIRPHRSVLYGYVALTVTPAERPRVLALLAEKGYAAEHVSGWMIAVHGKRPKGRSRFIEGQTVTPQAPRPCSGPPASTQANETPVPGTIHPERPQDTQRPLAVLAFPEAVTSVTVTRYPAPEPNSQPMPETCTKVPQV